MGGFPDGTSGKETANVVVKKLANAEYIRDKGLIPGLGKYPGGGHSHPFQYACLENPMDRGAEPGRLQSMWSQSQTLKCQTEKYLLPLSALKNLRLVNNKRP